MKIKRILVTVALMLCVFAFCSCDVDFYRGKRPVDYEGAVWVSEGDGYRMSFTVGKMSESVLQIDGEEDISFDFLWAMGYPTVTVHRYGDVDSQLFFAECEFGSKRFTMRIREFYFGEGVLPQELIFERAG